jgi:hypothetical protein
MAPEFMDKASIDLMHTFLSARHLVTRRDFLSEIQADRIFLSVRSHQVMAAVFRPMRQPNSVTGG